MHHQPAINTLLAESVFDLEPKPEIKDSGNLKNRAKDKLIIVSKQTKNKKAR